MKSKLIHSDGNSRLLLIFVGWGMDENVVACVRRPGYDVMAVYDYTDLTLDFSFAERYEEICLMAWSMGVFAASVTAGAIDAKLTLRIAVNGTTHPIHDSLGIPPDVFFGTLDNLTESSLEKFYRRMSSSRTDRELFESQKPVRPFDEVKEELRAISIHASAPGPSPFRWTRAVVGLQDRIFPPQNQRAAWSEEGVEVTEVPSGHFPDFQEIARRFIIDKSKTERRFGASQASYEEHAVVQRHAVDSLLLLLEEQGMGQRLREATGDILEIGSGSGILSRCLDEIAPKARITFWDLTFPAPLPEAKTGRHTFLNCDAETEITCLPDASLNFIFSASTVQWFNAPERFIRECARVLVPEGAVFLTTFTAGNLAEVTGLTGNTLPLLTPRQWIDICKEEFEVLAEKSWEETLRFDTPRQVLNHLKSTGVNSLGAGSREYGAALRLLRHYPMAPDGKYHLTYRPFVMILRKKR